MNKFDEKRLGYGVENPLIFEKITISDTKLMKTIFSILDNKHKVEAIRYLYWDNTGKVLVATNGKALMVIDSDEMRESFKSVTTDLYVKPLVTSKTEYVGVASDVEFPKWKHIIPEVDTLKEVFKEPISFEKQPKTTLKATFNKTAPRLLVALGQVIDLSYLEYLIGYSWRVYTNAENKPVLFKSEGITLVIMPIRVEKENGV